VVYVNCTAKYYIKYVKIFNFRTDINRACAKTKIVMDVLLVYKFSVCVKLMREFGPRSDFIHYSGFLLKMFSIHSCYFWKLLSTFKFT